MFKYIIIVFIIDLVICLQSFSYPFPVSPDEIITPSQQAKYLEKWLGVIEVGTTTKGVLELYIGKGNSIHLKNGGERTYYIDKINKRTLIVDSNYKGVIEIALYKNSIELPPGINDISKINYSKKLNIKNLMTSMGTRIGYGYMRIVGAYGRPSVEISGKNFKELKYIKLGSYNTSPDIVFLEYSFRLKKNKLYEIRIENGK